MIHLQLIHTINESADSVAKLINNTWPAPYANAAAHATREDGFINPTGDVFAIMYTSAPGYAPRMVGVTGYFRDSTATRAYLRWTGVLPGLRRQGFASDAISQLILMLNASNPVLSHLIELVPDNDYGRSAVIPAFEKIGFVRDDSIEVPAGENDSWSVIPYVLRF